MAILLRNVQKLVPVNLTRIETDLNLLRHILRLEKFDLGVMLINNKHMTKMNKMYRNLESPTDILSFPFHQVPPGEMPAPASEDEFCLGDILLGVPYIVDQCKKDGVEMHDMFTILLTHGLCHLLGHDHVDVDSWTRMYNKEMDILEKYNKLSGRNLSSLTVRPDGNPPL